jgi:2-keto-4-pentenoate hydratase/2-oxohepta-3-ene-1,7-dioic acid hydratase in catechol pathway
MRVARVKTPTGEIAVGRIEDEKFVSLAVQEDGPGRDALRDLLTTDIGRAQAIGAPLPLADCRLLSPVAAPSKILAIGLNYADHARERGQKRPAAPITFVKTNNTIVGPGEPVAFRTADSNEVDYEAELAVVIGRRARRVTRDEALQTVLGFTCCNDVSARDAQFGDGQWIRGKSFDTFCPLGPWIVTADEIPDPQALRIACRVNGQTLQDSSTAEMIFGVAHLISYLSTYITLEPGDVIATGTPSGVGFARQPPIYLHDGDVVDVEIEKIGTLTNPIQTRLTD